MLTIALISFAVAALLGLTLATKHLKGGAQTQPESPAPMGGEAPSARAEQREVPMSLAVLHGVFAAAGLLLLIIAVLKGTATGLATIALVIFVVAALGGFYLFATHLGKKPLPRPVIFVHGGAAGVAFVLLLLFALGL